MLRQSVREFLDDHCMRMAAALSYYVVFALPPLLILLIMLAGLIWNPEDVQGRIAGQIEALIGPEGARQVRTILAQADRPGEGGALRTALSIAALVFGATGAFAQLQDALNTAWEVKPDPELGGAKRFALKRLLSFGMILGVGFLLLVSLALTAALGAFGDAAAGLLPRGLSGVVLHIINAGISLVVIALLFAAIFRFLPDAVIAWRDVWFGAIATAVLFVAGKFLIGLYIGGTDPGSAYGAAGSLAILLLWIYFAAIVLLFGAELTQVWAERRGEGIRPEPGAVRVVMRAEPRP